MKNLPWAVIVGALSFTLGTGLTLYGVLLLAGPGWALVAAAVPCFLLSAVILRGLRA
jgi:hypothetical protein